LCFEAVGKEDSPATQTRQDKERFMAVTEEVVRANQEFAQGFTKGDLPMPPARQLAVLTCMDARLHPEKFLGLGIGDAHVIRNAGGRASDDAIRSLIISSQLLGTREYVVIHHTDCGMLTFTNRDLQQKLEQETGVDKCTVDFLPFSDLEESVREDIKRIEASPFIPEGIPVRGFIYDVRTGKLQPVEVPAAV
jgi:carbonic anhydrase